jgi:translocation protein SEC62
MSEVPAEYETPEGLRTLANFLRSQSGVKVRSGIEHEKRVDYFKGKKLVECVLEAKKWPRSIPQITDKGVARMVANLMVQANFFHRSVKVEDKKGLLKISPQNVFEETGYYTWMYSGNMVWSNIATGAVIAVVIGFTLLPIWPDSAKKTLWYLSITFLMFTMVFCLVRFILFLFFWLFGYEFWIFPRLFDESLSFQDSFKPIYTFEPGAIGQGYYRIAVLTSVIGFAYWACTQPTEFDGFMQAQKDFIGDLYSGNLLADVASDPNLHKDHTKKVPSLEDLLRYETDTHTHIHVYKRRDTLINTHTHIYTHIHTYTHTHTYSHIYTHIHTYTHIHSESWRTTIRRRLPTRTAWMGVLLV